MRYSTRPISLVVVVCAVGAAIVVSNMNTRARLTRHGQQTIVAGLVCDYLMENTNSWPPDWDSLEAYFIASYENTSPWGFSELKDEVKLDFETDGPSLIGIAVNAEKSAAFQAIQSKSGSNDYWETDPNQIVLDHFRNMISY